MIILNDPIDPGCEKVNIMAMNHDRTNPWIPVSYGHASGSNYGYLWSINLGNGQTDYADKDNYTMGSKNGGTAKNHLERFRTMEPLCNEGKLEVHKKSGTPWLTLPLVESGPVTIPEYPEA